MAKSIPNTAVVPADKVAILLEAYKKHSAELLAIETSQEKLIALILGFYSAGATLIAALVKDGAAFGRLQGPLTIVAILVLAFGLFYSRGRNDARRGTRTVLVNIEAALGFYQDGAYLTGTSLYPKGFFDYPKATFLTHGWWILVFACLGFVVVVFSVPPAG